MKNAWEWIEEDLIQLVDAGTKESVELDFKESPALQNTDHNKNEMSKDVSALANSAGGTLIYGIKENGHVATSIDGGVDPNTTSKEWVEQVISSRIHRKVDGIRINQVELHKTNKGNVAYVVFVPSSNRAPHQAYDKKFYKRYNFESTPMEEYEIRDASRREETPDLKIDFSLVSTNLTMNDETNESDPFELNASITNLAVEPANYAVIRVYIDHRLIVQGTGGLDKSEATLQVGTKNYSINLLSKNWAIPGNLPIFYTTFRVGDNPIKLKIRTKDKWVEQSFLIGYEVHSPRMPKKIGFTTLRLFQGSLSITETLTETEFLANFEDLIK